jgi:phage terminase large subunit-like protein
VVRAEPIASLCETGKVRMAGSFTLLEDELYGFTTHGFVGANSPNRADAMIWGMSDLFPQILSPPIDVPRETVQQPQRMRDDGLSWMGM